MSAPTITDANLKSIRSLDNFDLKMFLQELDEFGIKQALELLPLIEEAAMALAATHKGGSA